MTRALSITLSLTFALTGTLHPSTSTAAIAATDTATQSLAQRLPAQKKSKAGPAKELPKKLPAYKAKKRVKLNFDNTSDNSPKVVIRNDSNTNSPASSSKPSLTKSVDQAIKKAMGDQKAAHAQTNSSMKVSPAPLIQVARPTPTPKPEMKPALEPKPESTLPEKQTAEQQLPTSLPKKGIKFEDPTLIQAEPSVTAGPAQDDASKVVSVSESRSRATYAPELGFLSQGFAISLRGSYLDTKFDRIESDLENGASAMGIGLSRSMENYEIRASLDLVHSMDQAVKIQNTRLLTVRADFLKTFLESRIQPIVGMGVAISDFSIRSHRKTNAGEVFIREHASGTAFGLVPSLGIRGILTAQLYFDLVAEYQIYLGSDGSEDLSAFGATGALGVRF